MDSNVGNSSPNPPLPQLQPKHAINPRPGEVIVSTRTQCAYTMGEEIGEGYFSHVFECRDVWKNDLAAKVLKPLFSYEEVKAKANEEVFKLLQLRNPYITFVYDAFEFRETFYIITERCQGSLERLFDSPGISGKFWIIPVARCILQAVHYLHVEGFVHQDIHEGNVFAARVKDELTPFDPTKTALKFKLGDFGIAKLKSQVDVFNTRLDRINPPEVHDETQFGKIDHRVDIYHLGLLLLSLGYTERLRFTKEEILAGKPREMALQLPPPFNITIEKMLRRRVQHRTASALEVWRDLMGPGVENFMEKEPAQLPLPPPNNPISTAE